MALNAIPTPTRFLAVNLVPSALAIITWFVLYVLGASPSLVNGIVPPVPKTAYISLKFSFTLRNDSRMLSPVPSLPCIPMSISCFAIF